MFLFVLNILTILYSCLAVERFDSFRQSLDGQWTVTNSNGSITQDATVPGGIYSDLLASGVISDLFYRYNDVDYRWVSKDNWTYSIDFDVEEEILQKREVLLIFYGLDTIADIYLNDKLVDSTNNMFARYEYSVKDLLKVSGNHLEVKFTSPMTVATARFNKQAEDYIIYPECSDDVIGECHINFLRKMQASFSWDWGPAFPSMGIWKSVEILAFDTAIVRDITINYDTENSVLNFDVILEAGVGEGNISGDVYIIFNNDTSVSVQKTVEIVLSPETTETVETLRLEIPESSVEWWYPNGGGNQTLYTVEVTFSSEDSNDKSSIRFNYGFRNIELVQEPVSQENGSLGLTFYFKVNNIDVFAKGANWIPGHILPELSADKTRVRTLLESAKVVGMNMIRVWGGGFYESDTFYELADELGIMIWQDFTFASALYPANDIYLASVATEVRQHVRRLQYHPSLAAWSGNNENEIVLRSFFYNTEVYRQDYVKLFADTVMKVVQEVDPNRPFVMSSPSNGIETFEEGYIAENPTSPLYGDNHYYNYAIGGWNPYQYQYTRFASEYGFQSLPSFFSIKTVSEAEDWDLQSNFSAHRQHHPDGNAQMLLEILDNLPYAETGSAEDDYKSFIYFSQINQAMAIRTETEFYRRSRWTLNSNGEGKTMGALYWQLNDVWQAPSWSSIDFNGRWKMLHYFARDFFAPLMISPFITPEGNLSISIVSDELYDIIQAQLNVNIYSYDSFEPMVLNKIDIDIPSASGSLATYSVHLDEYLSAISFNISRDTVFLYAELYSTSGVAIATPSFLPLTSLGETTNIVNGNPEILSVTLSEESGSSTENQIFIIDLKSDVIALFVWLEAEYIEGIFSENGFVMVRPDKSVFFETTSQVTAEDIMNKLSVNSLNQYVTGS